MLYTKKRTKEDCKLKKRCYNIGSRDRHYLQNNDYLWE